MAQQEKSKDLKTFQQKSWVIGSILVLIITLFLFFRSTVGIFILILVGSLIACYFHGIAKLIKRKTKWSSKVSLIISVFGTILLIAGIFYLIGATVTSQISELGESLPKLTAKAQDFINNTKVGRLIFEQAQKLTTNDNLESFLSGFFETTFGGVGDLYVILLIGIYFTTSPELYKEGIAALVPPRGKEKAIAIMKKVASYLTKWLFGKFITMTIIFVFTAIVLSIIGLPMWLALAFIAGLLVFIPNFGPMISAIPVLLVALAESVNTAIIVGILFFIIQMAEGSYITPKLQNRLVKVPPALIILAQVFGGTLIGVLGIVFATPIVIIIMVLVQELYIKPMEKKAKDELVKKPQ